MDFVLSTDDLAQMPVGLRQNLLSYLSQAVVEQSSQENGRQSVKLIPKGGFRCMSQRSAVGYCSGDPQLRWHPVG